MFYTVKVPPTREYGWEVVTVETDIREALARLREYRENQPEYPARLHRRPLSHSEAIHENGDI